MDQKKSRTKLRGILLLNGMTLKDFAHKYGWRPAAVRMTIMRYWENPDAKPWGKVSKAIIAQCDEYYNQHYKQAA